MNNTQKISKMCKLVVIVVLLTVVAIYFFQTSNDKKDKEGQKRLITTGMVVTTEQTHSHTEPIINVTATSRENVFVFPIELPMYGRRIINSTNIWNRLFNDDVYINDISLRSVLNAKFDIGLGKVNGWLEKEAEEKHMLGLTSRRLTIVIKPKTNLTIPRNRVQDMRRFLLLDEIRSYYRVKLNLRYIYPDETVEYLLR